MRRRLENTDYRALAARMVIGASIALLAVLAPAAAQQSPPGAEAPAQGGVDAPQGTLGADSPGGLPPPNFPTSPHRGVIDGWTGKPIPCRCRFEGQQLELGTVVCMSTHVGTVLTRCDIVGNNTSWVPSRQPCTPKVGS